MVYGHGQLICASNGFTLEASHHFLCIRFLLYPHNLLYICSPYHTWAAIITHIIWPSIAKSWFLAEVISPYNPARYVQHLTDSIYSLLQVYLSVLSWWLYTHHIIHGCQLFPLFPQFLDLFLQREILRRSISHWASLLQWKAGSRDSRHLSVAHLSRAWRSRNGDSLWLGLRLITTVRKNMLLIISFLFSL